jgi:hypothetical protein
MESLARTSADASTNNSTVDRFLFERVVRENEEKMSMQIRRRYPPALQAPPPPTTGDGSDGEADLGPHAYGNAECGSEATDIADLFAAVQTAPPVAFDADVVIPVFREVAEGVGNRVASLTAPKDDSHKHLAQERVSESKLVTRKSSVHKLLAQFQQQESSAPVLRRRGLSRTSSTTDLPPESPREQEPPPPLSQHTDRTSSPDVERFSALDSAQPPLRRRGSVRVASTSRPPSRPPVGGADATVGLALPPPSHARGRFLTSSNADRDTGTDARGFVGGAHGETTPETMAGTSSVVVPRNRFRSQTATAPRPVHTTSVAPLPTENPGALIPAWRLELIERRKQKREDQERIAGQATTLFGGGGAGPIVAQRSSDTVDPADTDLVVRDETVPRVTGTAGPVTSAAPRRAGRFSRTPAAPVSISSTTKSAPPRSPASALTPSLSDDEDDATLSV